MHAENVHYKPYENFGQHNSWLKLKIVEERKRKYVISNLNVEHVLNKTDELLGQPNVLLKWRMAEDKRDMLLNEFYVERLSQKSYEHDWLTECLDKRKDSRR